MKLKKLTHILTLGFALFAMFFGAGNLLLPPFIGLQSSDSWLWTTLGFTITGIIIPFLGIISVVISGESFTDLGNRINKNLGVILGVIIMIGIGPLIAIPRTAATTYEVGVLPLFAEASAIMVSIGFFIVVALLSLSKSKVVDLIGNYLTPLLILILILLIAIGVMSPANELFVEHFGNADAFILGFEEGYQTLDVLASVIFAGIIISAAKLKGYTTVKQKTEIVIASGFLAATCLFFIYGGLVCLTTAVALTTAVGSFFSKLFKSEKSYRAIVFTCCIFSCALSITGVDKIIEYAYPFLAFVYPIVITLVLYIVISGRFVKDNSPFIGAVVATAVIAAVGLLDSFGMGSRILNNLIDHIPLATYDLAWILPSFILFIGILLINKAKNRNLKTLVNPTLIP